MNPMGKLSQQRWDRRFAVLILTLRPRPAVNSGERTLGPNCATRHQQISPGAVQDGKGEGGGSEAVVDVHYADP